MKSTGMCEMCGHQVAITQEAHIIAENNKTEVNTLKLCPTCHLMFDTHLKPKIFLAMDKAGIRLPDSWKKSIYHQAAEASARSRAATNTKQW